MAVNAFTWTSAVTLLAMLMYFWNTISVGRARIKYGVKAPAVTGSADFERAFRVQQNTVEQLVLFLPSLWLFALAIGDVWAGALGAVWIVGRVLYALDYVRAAEKRGRGFGIALMANLLMLIGAIVGWFI